MIMLKYYIWKCQAMNRPNVDHLINLKSISYLYFYRMVDRHNILNIYYNIMDYDITWLI